MCVLGAFNLPEYLQKGQFAVVFLDPDSIFYSSFRQELLLSDEQAEEVPKLIAKSEEAKVSSSPESPEYELIPTTVVENLNGAHNDRAQPAESLDFR